MSETIAAISTSMGVGAISIIRVSGPDAIVITNKIFKGKNLTTVNSHTINYGKIVENNKIVDEVLVSVMKAPHTYTTENITEINCHGSIASVNKILEMLILNGCRLAEPGEFTKRAFLNGRIDLLKAEGIMDLINSKTERSLNLAIKQLSGTTSKLITDMRDKLLSIIATIEVKIDYPEYEDIEDITHEQLLDSINNLEIRMKQILESSKNAKIIKEGIKTSIIGKPNVGKSSILNRLIEEDKAIVTSIAGTTRDIVEGQINIDGIILNLIDTAGIRKTTNIVENIGVKKSIELIENSDLILLVLDNSQILIEDDYKILDKIKQKNYIIIINKSDLPSKIDFSKLNKNNIVELSAINNDGFEELKLKIKELYQLDKLESPDLTYLTSSRSIALLKKAISKFPEITTGIKNNMPIDMIELDIKETWNILGEIIGESYEEELVNRLFSQFCLGK